MNGPGTDLRATPVLPRHGRRGDTGMIPLINIALLLLIFFLLAGRIDDGQDLQEIRPPTSASEKSLPHPSVIVSLDTKGRLTLNGGGRLVRDGRSRVGIRAGPATGGSWC